MKFKDVNNVDDLRKALPNAEIIDTTPSKSEFPDPIPASKLKSKKSKYSAVRTTVDGIEFASRKEAAQYSKLKMMEQNGLIRGLELQPKFPLLIRPFDQTEPPVQVGNYIADFAYTDGKTGLVVIDVKGFKTPVYRLKKKIVEALYGITITEV